MNTLKRQKLKINLPSQKHSILILTYLTHDGLVKMKDGVKD
jgi:hypothetical protein